MTASCWLWLGAAATVVMAVVLAVRRLDEVRAVLAGAVRDSDPSTPADTVEQVVDVSVLVIVVGGLLFGVAGGLLALTLRAGRRWARVTLTAVAVLAVAYGVLVVSATGWPVLAYAALATAAAVCMYLPGSSRWFG